MSCVKTGAALCSSMINLCSPGLLLSAVVTFHSPFTQFYVSKALVQRCGPICWRKRRSSFMQGASVIPSPPSLRNASFANTCSEHTWSCAKQPGQAQKVAAPSPPFSRSQALLARHCFLASDCSAGVAIKRISESSGLSRITGTGEGAARWNKSATPNALDLHCPRTCSGLPDLTHADALRIHINPKAWATATFQTAPQTHRTIRCPHAAQNIAWNWDSVTNGQRKWCHIQKQNMMHRA